MSFEFEIHLTLKGRFRAPTICTVKNLHITYSWLSVSTVPLDVWFSICRFKQQGIMQYCSIYNQKKQHTNGLTQFKPILSKGHLYCLCSKQYVCEMLLLLSYYNVSDSFATPWTIACQIPLSMRFPRREHWSGLPFPSPGYLFDSGIEPTSPGLAGGFFTTEPPGKPVCL